MNKLYYNPTENSNKAKPIEANNDAFIKNLVSPNYYPQELPDILEHNFEIFTIARMGDPRDWLDYTHKLVSSRHEEIGEEKMLFVYKWMKKKENELAQLNNENIGNESYTEMEVTKNSIVSKIIYLHELGILAFIFDKYKLLNPSPNLVAKILSPIIGEKTGTIQSYLNPIYSKEANQVNNPLKSKKAREKVQEHLINLNIPLDKSN